MLSQKIVGGTSERECVRARGCRQQQECGTVPGRGNADIVVCMCAQLLRKTRRLASGITA